VMAVSRMAQEYGAYGLLTAPGAVPLAFPMALLGGALRSLGGFLLLIPVLLLFPTGRLPSPRWRWPARLIIGANLVGSAGALFDPDLTDLDGRLAGLRNPMAQAVPDWLVGLWTLLALVALLASLIACVVAIVVRFRRARGAERQQMKWLTYAGVFAGAVFVVVFLSALFDLPFNDVLGGFLFMLILAPVPAAVGIAILRYRLYDIDVLIRRTLIYTALTASLALVYFGGVLVLETILQPLTGGGNDLAIVATTLLIAALFNPLRRRIQAFIDRRFYRRKYDAAQIVAAFSAHLREEVDLPALGGRLVAVVDEAVQPAGVTLWLRESSPGGSEGMQSAAPR